LTVIGPARPTVIASREEAVTVAKRFAAAIADGVIERDRPGALPVAGLAEFDSSGLLGLAIAREDGGSGLGATELAEVVRTIAAVDPAVAQGPQGHYLFADVLTAFGTDAQRRQATLRLGEGALAPRVCTTPSRSRGSAIEPLDPIKVSYSMPVYPDAFPHHTSCRRPGTNPGRGPK
jgi:alkylation response protein AidB-like acyl-CoA dehydrogenase